MAEPWEGEGLRGWRIIQENPQMTPIYADGPRPGPRGRSKSGRRLNAGRGPAIKTNPQSLDGLSSAAICVICGNLLATYALTLPPPRSALRRALAASPHGRGVLGPAKMCESGSPSGGERSPYRVNFRLIASLYLWSVARRA